MKLSTTATIAAFVGVGIVISPLVLILSYVFSFVSSIVLLFCGINMTIPRLEVLTLMFVILIYAGIAIPNYLQIRGWAKAPE